MCSRNHLLVDSLVFYCYFNVKKKKKRERPHERDNIPIRPSDQEIYELFLLPYFRKSCTEVPIIKGTSVQRLSQRGWCHILHKKKNTSSIDISLSRTCSFSMYRECEIILTKR